MSRHSVVEAPDEKEDLVEELELPPRSRLPRAEDESIPSRHARSLFTDSLLELSDTRPKTRALDFILSFAVQFVVLGLLLLIPLFFTDAIDLRQFAQTMLVAPPPPPPPPPPAAPAVVRVTQAPKRVFTVAGKLLAPTVIPQKIAMIKEEQLPPDIEVAGVVGGVPGGVPGGQVGGVLGGILGSSTKAVLPIAPAPAAPKAPIRVGGRIQEPRVILRVDPTYPMLARQARIEGEVVIDAVIDEKGNVVEMQVVSGHALLIPAALDALKKWRYQPTILNEEPVRVQLLVTLRFRLG